MRIGHLTAVARDSWWLVREGDTPAQTAATADGVCAAVTGTAVPEIHRRPAQLAAPAADGIPG
ncbi:hypothetical protein [Kitasatospora sp. NPDC051914]|uniref:hypothetical protein n=1 Tax=Kitasatospora sp. NPDC051914 TaxID=3154945 RepID=UPI00343695FE